MRCDAFRRAVSLGQAAAVALLLGWGGGGGTAASAQCPPPALYEIGGAGAAVTHAPFFGHQAISRGRRVQIVQTNVSPPVAKGSVALDGGVIDMHNGAYIWAIDRTTLYGIDTADPSAPQIIGRITPPVNPGEILASLRNRGNHVYVVTQFALYIIDVSNPAVPVFRSRYAPPDAMIYDVEVVGSYAYLAVQTAPARTMLIVDVSSPAQPTAAGSEGTGWGLRFAMAPGNPSLYVIRRENAQTVRIDKFGLSSPTSPILQASTADFTAEQNYQDRLLATSNTVAYLNLDTGQISLFHPTSLQFQQITPALEGATAFAADWPNIFVARHAGGLHRVNVVSPTAPITTADYLDVPPGFIYGIANINTGMTVTVGGGHAWFFTNPTGAQPALVRHLEPATPGGGYTSVTMLNDIAYLAELKAGVAGGTIHAYRMALAPAPSATLLGTYVHPGPFPITAIAAGIDGGAGRRIYFTSANPFPEPATLHILNAAIPGAISHTSSFTLTSGVAAPITFVPGSTLVGTPARLLVGGDERMQIVNVNLGPVPAPLGVIEAPSADAIAHSFHTTVWLLGRSGLRAFNISTPAAPVELGALSVPGGTAFAFINPFAALAAVTASNGRLGIINTQDPGAPFYTQIADVGMDGYALAFDGTRLHLADGPGGYLVVPPAFGAPPAQDPGAPRPLGRLCPGTDIMLAAKFVASPAVASHQWFKDGVPLADGPTGAGAIISGSTTATLTIENPGPADVARYDCEATNSCGAGAVLAFVTFHAADCDESGDLDFFDFLCFQNLFAAGDPEADCDGGGGLDFFDFLCFQNEFAAGCP